MMVIIISWPTSVEMNEKKKALEYDSDFPIIYS